jgi:hypothetical protein
MSGTAFSPFVTFNGTWTTRLANIGEATKTTASTANMELRCCRIRQRQVVSFRMTGLYCD